MAITQEELHMSFNPMDFLSQTDLNEVKARTGGGLPKGRYDFVVKGYELAAQEKINDKGEKKEYMQGKLTLSVNAVIAIDDSAYDGKPEDLLGRNHIETDYVEYEFHKETGEKIGLTKDGLGTLKARILQLCGVKENSNEYKEAFGGSQFQFPAAIQMLTGKRVQAKIVYRVNKQNPDQKMSEIDRNGGMFGVLQEPRFATQFVASGTDI